MISRWHIDETRPSLGYMDIEKYRIGYTRCVVGAIDLGAIGRRRGTTQFHTRPNE